MPVITCSAQEVVSYKRLTYDELAGNAKSFQHVDVSVIGIFHKSENLWQPFFTPFIPEDYLAFSLWAPTTELWTLDGRKADLPTFFVPKDSRHVKTLLGLNEYDIVEIKGRVQSFFRDLPWTEVHSIRKVRQINRSRITKQRAATR